MDDGDSNHREAPAQEKHGSNGLCPNSVSTPPLPQANGRFVEAIFAKNLSIFENSGLTLEMDILTITMVNLCF